MNAREFEQKEKYKKYMLSNEWKYKRALVMRRCMGACEGCGENKAKEVHHTTYKNFGNEFLFELQALCYSCHDRIHGHEHHDENKKDQPLKLTDRHGNDLRMLKAEMPRVVLTEDQINKRKEMVDAKTDFLIRKAWAGRLIKLLMQELYKKLSAQNIGVDYLSALREFPAIKSTKQFPMLKLLLNDVVSIEIDGDYKNLHLKLNDGNKYFKVYDDMFRRALLLMYPENINFRNIKIIVS